ncbi:MAG: decaprenyl-phosphate phosphoribosyltransferase [Thermoanaerobaculia bacterium]
MTVELPHSGARSGTLAKIRALARSLRPHQWAKNLFVLAPLVFGKELDDPASLARAGAAFVAFCLLSSTVYLVNDVRDRQEDRRHPLKRHRPIASGLLPVPLALAAAGGLAAAGALLAGRLGGPTLGVAAGYVLLHVLYSSGLKHQVILDVMIVAVGFVLRVLAGGLAIGVEVSSWLLLCTIFLALFLAFSKRRHEIVLLAEEAPGQRRVLDHYSPAFLDQMINVVTASAVVCYALYAISPETAARFDSRWLVYTVPLVLFGIFRYLYLIYQRPDEKNPTEAILTDPPFLANLGLWALAVLWIVYGT